MGIAGYNSRIAKLKRDFILGHEIKNTMRDDVLTSWQTCKNLGLDSELAFIEKRDRATGERLFMENYRQSRRIQTRRINNYGDTLGRNGMAVAYLMKDLTMVAIHGHSSIINALEEVNIGIGTIFAEDIVGTNAAALAIRTMEKAYVLGEEHYIKALTSYCCMAVPYANHYYPQERLFMVIAKTDNFDAAKVELSSYFPALMSTTLDLNRKKIELDMAYQQMQRYFIGSDRVLLLIDDNGRIIWGNLLAADLAGCHADDLINKELAATFPELSFTLECFTTQKEYSFKEVHFRNKQSYFLDCRLIMAGKSCEGLSIAMESQKKMRSKFNTISNYRAIFEINDILGDSSSSKRSKEIAMSAAKSASNVLISGESGTGKELYAQAIHNASNRKNNPFVSINCASIPGELIGSELFGYKEGAFTGAAKGGAAGKFELAHTGTIFLDEIAEMPLNMQAVLLRVLEERKIIRIGGHQPIDVDVRVIAATNTNLWQAVKNKTFRLDLYFRLNVIRLELAPLRERKEEIPILIHYFIKKYSKELKNNLIDVSNDAMECFKTYDWPGNVRELRNIIEQIANFSSNNVLEVSDIPTDIIKSINFYEKQMEADTSKNDIVKILHDFGPALHNKLQERDHLIDILGKHNGNKKNAAKELNIGRTTLYRKLKAYGIK